MKTTDQLRKLRQLLQTTTATYHDTGLTGTSDKGGENGTRGIISSETGWRGSGEEKIDSVRYKIL
jgi:hypothetical protein